MLCNRVMKMKPFVANAKTIYDSMRKVFPQSLINSLITATFCRALTAGTTLETAEEVSGKFRDQGIFYINIRNCSYFGLLC